MPSSGAALVSPAAAERRISSRSARAAPDHRSAVSRAMKVRAKVVMVVSLFKGVRRLHSSLVHLFGQARLHYLLRARMPSSSSLLLYSTTSLPLAAPARERGARVGKERRSR